MNNPKKLDAPKFEEGLEYPKYVTIPIFPTKNKNDVTNPPNIAGFKFNFVLKIS